MATLHDLNTSHRTRSTEGGYAQADRSGNRRHQITKGIQRMMREIHHKVGEAKRTLLGLVIVTGSLFWSQLRLAEFWGGDFSAYGSMLTAASLLSVVFYTLIRYGHAKLDPIAQLREGNTAVALYFFCYALLVVAAAVSFKP